MRDIKEITDMQAKLDKIKFTNEIKMADFKKRMEEIDPKSTAAFIKKLEGLSEEKSQQLQDSLFKECEDLDKQLDEIAELIEKYQNEEVDI